MVAFFVVIRRARIHFYFVIITMIEDWCPWIQLNWKCTISSTLCTVYCTLCTVNFSSIPYSGLKITQTMIRAVYELCCWMWQHESWTQVLSLKRHITLLFATMRKFSMDYLNLMQILFQTKQRTSERTKDKIDFGLFMFLLFFAFINTIILLFRRPCYYHPPSQRDSRCEKENVRKKEEMSKKK